MNSNLMKFGLTTKDVSDWVIESEVSSEDTKVTSYYIVQRFQGIEIFNAQSTVSVKEGKVINMGNRFKKDIGKKINSISPSLSVIEAINSAYSHLGIEAKPSFSIVETINKNAFKLSDGIQEDLISAKLVYQPTSDDKLKLAWAFQFYSPDGKHLWDLRIDALNGTILEKNDLTVSCNFGNSKQNNFPSGSIFNLKKTDLVNKVSLPLQIIFF